MLGFLSAGAGELGAGDGELDVNANMSMYGFISSHVASSERFVWRTFWTNAKKESVASSVKQRHHF